MSESKTPVHVAVIPDGNRRWAVRKGLKAAAGHRAAAREEHLRDLLDCAREEGVHYMSFWAFSTENWKRSPAEVKHLFSVIAEVISILKRDAIKNRICCKHIGRKDRIPTAIRAALEDLEEVTRTYTDFYVLLCVDYGGRDELIRAATRMAEEGKGIVSEELLLPIGRESWKGAASGCRQGRRG